MNTTTLPPQSGRAAPESPKPPLWHVGTLTYTSAGLIALFFWLLWGDFAWSMRDRSIGNVILILFKKFEASDMLTGLLMSSLPSALGLLIGPIISYRSDRHRGRWGRRIPFLLIPTPIIVLSMMGLAVSPKIGTFLFEHFGLHSFGLNPTILVILGVNWMLFEFGCIIANSVFGALVNDVVPQAVLGRFFGMFRAISLIAGMIFNYWLIGRVETHYFEIFLGIAALYGACLTIMCLKVKEGKYPPPPEPVEIPGAAGGFWLAVKTYFRECFGNPHYLWFFAMMTASGLAIAPVNLFGIFYANSISMSMGMYGKCLAITYLISLFLAYPVGALVDRFHPMRVCLAALGLYGICALWGGFYARSTFTFSLALVAHGVISGIYFTAVASMGQKLLPRSRFAQLSSACGIVIGICSIIMAPALGMFLDYTGHNYHYTFFTAAIFSGLAVFASSVMYHKFKACGGPDNYIAPE